MADVELVIKISKKVYNALTHIEFDANLVTDEMRKSITNGTPLPKGHGKLIDANEVLKKAFIREDDEGDVFVEKYYCIEKRYFDNLPTIIEADRESEGKNEFQRLYIL